MAAQDDADLDDDLFFDDLEDEAQDSDKKSGTHRAESPGAWARFRLWRKQRPFVPGLLILLSGIVMLAPAYFTVQVSDLLVMISTISGVSTLLIGALLIMFGIGTWLQPHAAPYLGVLSILVAIVAVPTSNLGGFFIGSLLGIVGGALALAWEKEDRKSAPRHARPGRKEPLLDDEAPPANLETTPTEVNGEPAEPAPRGGSTRIDLSALRSAKGVALVLAGAGLVAANVVGEPAVNAQEPVLPNLPALPEISIPVPTLPPLPTNVQLPPAPELPKGSSDLPVQLPTPQLPQLPDPRKNLPQPNLEPTRTIAPQNLSTVTADHVAITGNVHATMGMINVGDVPTRTLILTGDRLVARNLSLEIPGFAARGMLTTGPVETKVYNGPVQVVATGLTATPVVAGLPTLPVTVDLSGTVGDVLDQLGVPDPHPVPNVPVPDFVMDHIALGNVNMQMVSLYGLNFHAPAVQLKVPK